MTRQKYQPKDRLVDNADRLRELYCEQDKTIREIANEDAELGRNAVHDALREHGILGDQDDNSTRDHCRGRDPPERGSASPDWTAVP